MKLFYRCFIALYPFFVKLLGVKNEKAQLWCEGRKNIFAELKSAFAHNSDPVIWVHCSSLGEFEQGRILIENPAFKPNHYKILLTFFSPSGYEIHKNYVGADWVFYLPMDGEANAQTFYNIVKPALILFIKYDFWFYYLNEAKQSNIPLVLVSGIFRSNQIFFKWYGQFYRNMLACFTQFFVQNEASKQLLAGIGISENVLVSGDTRFDRVIAIAQNFTPIAAIEQFIGTNKVIVAGSTWTEDDEELDHFANTHPHIKFIIAPHDIQQSRIEECLRLYKNAVLYTDLINPSTNIKQNTANVLIINNIGLLSKLFKYATICYIGGGFGNDGVHNVLEAAVYNKPVIFGPEYDKYVEATDLIDKEAAFSVENALELEALFNQLLTDEIKNRQAGTLAGKYVQQHAGATAVVCKYLYEKRLLTN